MAQTASPLIAFDTTVVSAVKEAKIDALSRLALALKNACEPADIVLSAEFTDPTLISIDVALEQLNIATVAVNNNTAETEETGLQRLAETALHVADAFAVIAEEADTPEFAENALKAAEAFTNVSEAAEEASALAADVAGMKEH